MLQPHILGSGLGGVGMPFAEINSELASHKNDNYIQSTITIEHLWTFKQYTNNHNTLIVYILFSRFYIAFDVSFPDIPSEHP